MKKLKAGDIAPDFTLKNQDGKEIMLKNYKGEKLFVYFYPKANTPGCTTQTCNIQTSLPDFTELKVNVLGISPDSSEKQKKFAEKYKVEFNLLCDEEKTVSDNFGVYGEKKLYGKTYMGIIRSSFLIDENGKIMECWYKISPKDTVPKAMKFLN